MNFFDIDENGSKFEKSCLKPSQIASLGLFCSKIIKNRWKTDFYALKISILDDFGPIKSNFSTVFMIFEQYKPKLAIWDGFRQLFSNFGPFSSISKKFTNFLSWFPHLSSLCFKSLWLPTGWYIFPFRIREKKIQLSCQIFFKRFSKNNLFYSSYIFTFVHL